jgi:non-specific serine/threonine protein kinase
MNHNSNINKIKNSLKNNNSNPNKKKNITDFLYIIYYYNNFISSKNNRQIIINIINIILNKINKQDDINLDLSFNNIILPSFTDRIFKKKKIRPIINFIPIDINSSTFKNKENNKGAYSNIYINDKKSYIIKLMDGDDFTIFGSLFNFLIQIYLYLENKESLKYICLIYELGINFFPLNSTKKYYSIMKYCDINLWSFINDNSKINNIKEALHIMIECTKALKIVHDLELVHNDIKPENFLIKQNDNSYSIKIIDFDFVSSIGEELERGTPTYTSHSHKKTIITDIYSLSLVFLDIICIFIDISNIIILAQHYVVNNKKYIPRKINEITQNYYEIKKIINSIEFDTPQKKLFYDLINYILFEMTFHYPKKNTKNKNKTTENISETNIYFSAVDYLNKEINSSVVNTLSCNDIIKKLELFKSSSNT